MKTKSRAEFLLHPQPLSRSGWRATIIAVVILVAAIFKISIAYENEGDLNVNGGLVPPSKPRLLPEDTKMLRAGLIAAEQTYSTDSTGSGKETAKSVLRAKKK